MAKTNPVRRMMEATYHCARVNGLENLNLKDIGPVAGMTYQNMYNYFSGKDELVLTCFVDYDKKIASLFDGLEINDLAAVRLNDRKAFINKMWLLYFNFLVSHPDETIFYMQFRLSAGFYTYQSQRDESHFTHFMAMVSLLDTENSLGRVNQSILWAYVINTSLIFAKYVIEGRIPDTEASRIQMFSLLMNGLSAIL